MFGLDPDTIRNIKQVFAKIPDIDKVILYGSRAKGNYRNGSDIDITLFGENLTLNNSVYPLMDELEELYLPYMFDISIFEDIDNEDLIENINRAGKVFYRKERGLPKGWEEKTLGEVCDVIAGQSPEGKYYNSEGNGLPFYQGKKEFSQKFIGEPTKWTTKVTKEAEANDILMSVRAPVGPINFSTQKICIGRGLAAIRVKELIDNKFLFNFLLKHENEIIGNTGAVFNSINKKQIENIEIPLPPLPEQKRIVAILDQAFTAIAKAKANTEQNLKNAREVFQSYLQWIFENKEYDWEEIAIKELTELITKGSSPKWQGVNYVDKGGIFFLTSKNVGEGELLLNNKKHLEEKFNDIQKTSILKKGDVLTNIVGASIGRTAIFDLDEITNINQAVCLMRCIPKKVYNQYLMYLLNSPFFKNILHDNEVDNARANLSLTFFKNLIVPLPDLSKQKK